MLQASPFLRRAFHGAPYILLCMTAAQLRETCTQTYETLFINHSSLVMWPESRNGQAGLLYSYILHV